MSDTPPRPDTAPRPDAAVIEALRGLATPLLSDQLDRLSGTVGLVRRNAVARLVGPALTVKTRAGDNLAIYRAFERLQPGDVLVVDGGGDLANALVGELMMLYARSIGCAGFVIDGAVRDVEAFAAHDFPCFSRGVCHRGPYKSGPGHVGVPVAVGGQVVMPGDLVCGDADGIVVVAAADAARVVAGARAKEAEEEAVRAAILGGKSMRPWLDAVLAPARPKGQD